ncbi:BspA family leucine-rich repeat surface protein, partial [Apilactobacillus ozensis]|uniref:BspA family leucine-rich repeat surface protein n=1 Tax=Apilactobacillus ozensis TaxID=866801 RepID=UPI0020922C52
MKADDKVVTEGTNGTCHWKLDSDGTLTIESGTLSKGIADTLDSDNVSKIKHIILSGKVYAPTDSSYLFSDMDNLESIENMENLDTSNVVNMTSIFQSNPKLENLDLSKLDVTKVTSMSRAFADLPKVKHLDVSKFNTSNVTNMNELFSADSSLESIDVGGWDTSNVTNMNTIFLGTNISKLDLSNWNMDKVTVAPYMFAYSGIKYINISNKFSIPNNADSGIFEGSNSLWKIKISNNTFGNNNELLKNNKIKLPDVPGDNKEFTDGDITFVSTQKYWKEIGQGSDHNPLGDILDTNSPIKAGTYVWDNYAKPTTP